jgi:hypothetical protein
MEIRYFKDGQIPSRTNVEFVLWDMVQFKKYFLDADGGNTFVPECGMIPGKCRFHLGVDQNEFEDAVLELAKKIERERKEPGDMHDDIIYDPQPTVEDKLIAIIEKLVSK